MLPRHHLGLHPSCCGYRKRIQHNVDVDDHINLLFLQEFPQFSHQWKIARPRFDPPLSQVLSADLRVQRIERGLSLFCQAEKTDLIGVILPQSIGKLDGHALCSSAARDIPGKKADLLSHSFLPPATLSNSRNSALFVLSVPSAMLFFPRNHWKIKMEESSLIIYLVALTGVK